MEKEITEEIGAEMNVYEASFNISPFLSEEALAQEYGNIKENLSKIGAIFISEQYPKQLELAYTMERVISNKKQKFNQAFFGWTKFEVSAEGLASFEKTLKADENIIRYLIIRTVRENTLAPKKTFNRSSGEKSTRAPEAFKVVTEDAVEMDKEAVDKKIEELVV